MSTNSLTISWTAPSDPAGPGQESSGWAFTRVYRDGNPVVSPNNPVPAPLTTFVDTGLLPDTPYQYSLCAIDRAGNESPISSPTVPGRTEAISTSSVFGDYGGRAFAGEPGALAVNNNWASPNPLYDYIPQFAPTIPTIPTFGTTPAGERAVVTNRSQLIAALGDTAIKKIFVAKGFNDHGGTRVPVTLSGTAAAPRWILYYDSADANKDLRTFSPWNIAVGNAARTQLPALEFIGTAGHYYIIGLTWGEHTEGVRNVAPFPRSCLMDVNAHHLVWYRCLLENFGGHAWNVAANGCNDIMAYQCVSRRHDGGGLRADGTWDSNNEGLNGDIHAFHVNGGINIRIVSCESYDTRGDCVQYGQGGNGEGCVIEDCDFWVSEIHRCDANGNPDPNGAHFMGQNCVTTKQVLASAAANPMKVWGNRMFNWRRGTSARHGGGDNNGHFISLSNDTEGKHYIDYRRNILHVGTPLRVINWNAGTEISDHFSFVRNIVADVDAANHTFNIGVDNVEFYLNTIIRTDCGIMVTFQSTDPVENHDQMGNLWINVTGSWATGQLAATSRVGYACYGGTFTQFNKTYGGDLTFPSAATLAMGNFRYTRKKLTGPETATINGVVPTTTTPAAVRSLVPMSGTNQIGSRPGIGVDNAT
jgi:hypothetical protein